MDGHDTVQQSKQGEIRRESWRTTDRYRSRSLQISRSLQANETSQAQPQTQDSTKSVSSPPKTEARLGFALRRPFMVLLGAWLLSVFVGGVAILSIIKIDPSETARIHSSGQGRADGFQQESRLTPAPSLGHSTQERSASKTDNKPVDPEESLPLFSLAIVALSCAVGSLLICQRSKSSQTSKPLKASGSKRLPRTSTGFSRQKHQNFEASISPGQIEVTSASEATVTVVSPDESHPLDWDEPSLADHLDLRQRKPLSYWF